VAYNDTIAARRETWADGCRKLSDTGSKRLTEVKKAPEWAWLGEVSSVVLQRAVADANTAHRNWLSSLSGKRKGPKLGAPRFRSRRDNQQAGRFTKNARFSVAAGGKLRLPKIGDVEVHWSRDLPSAPSSVTVIMDAAGLDNPRYLRNAERCLKRAQQALSRKEKGPKNRAKARVKVARSHARVDRFFPSSQICSACEVKVDPKPQQESPAFRPGRSSSRPRHPTRRHRHPLLEENHRRHSA
jgi:putative transposase